ncbi:MAG TPA: hypothetical protein VNL18_01710 [Gemmatimonadales bacterium]|nr:hypothetical protein [Gemmatimonadales bacterium]
MNELDSATENLARTIRIVHNVETVVSILGRHEFNGRVQFTGAQNEAIL